MKNMVNMDAVMRNSLSNLKMNSFRIPLLPKRDHRGTTMVFPMLAVGSHVYMRKKKKKGFPGFPSGKKIWENDFLN